MSYNANKNVHSDFLLYYVFNTVVTHLKVKIIISQYMYHIFKLKPAAR